MNKNNYNYNGAANVMDDNVVREIFSRVFGWMCAGLFVTAAVAYLLIETALSETVMSNPIILLLCAGGELVLVFTLSARIHKLSVPSARLMFLLYSALNGASISIILSMYTTASVFFTFLVCAIMFLVMAILGVTVKMDLSRYSSLLIGGLIGIIVASLLNAFIFRSAGIDLLITYAGILVFLGITAYDIQWIKNYAYSFEARDFNGEYGVNEVVHKVAVIGALNLYLDFINLFLKLLRLFGKRRK